MFIRTVIGGLLTGLVSLSASAALVYDEAIDGDLSATNTSASASNFFLLDEGLTVISGTATAGISPFVAGSDIDNFAFNLVDGTALNSVVLRFSNVTPNEVDASFLSLRYNLGNLDFSVPSFSSLAGMDIQLFTAPPNTSEPTASPSDLFALALPLTRFDTGFYRFSTTTITTGNGTGSFDYTIELNVSNASAVPVPAAAWLFGSAVLGLAGLRAKRA